MHRTPLVHSLAMPRIQGVPIRFPSSMLSHIEQAWKFSLWVVITSHLDMVRDHDDTECIPGAITSSVLGISHAGLESWAYSSN